MTFLIDFLGSKVLDVAWDEARRRILGKRLQTARRILIEELSRGNADLVDVADVDEAAAMGFEYAEMAVRGTARRNLRMLAQILAGAVVTPPIYADGFLRWSRILADLTREEIIVLARLHKLRDNPILQTSDGNKWSEIGDNLLREMQGEGIVTSKPELEGILNALQRTGLVIYEAGGYGGAWHVPSPLLEKLLRLIEIEVVLKEPQR